MAPIGRAVLAFAVLATAGANCAASLSFDEAHSALAATVSDVEDTATSIVSALTSTVLGGVTRSPSVSISVEIASEEASGGESDETHTVSMTKRPTTTVTVTVTDAPVVVTRAPALISVASEAPEVISTATEAPVVVVPVSPTTIYIGTDAPASTEAPETSGPTTVAAVVDTQAPAAAVTATPTVVETQTPVGVPAVKVTQPPIQLVPTTAPVALETQAPAATVTETPPVEVTQVPVADTPTTTESSSMADPERGVDGESEVPAAGSMSGDAVVIVPDESTAVPLATTGSPVATGSKDASPSTPSAGVPEESDWSTSFASSSNNDTVTTSSEGGNDATSDGGISPGEVHASSSAEISLDGSSDQEDTHDTESPASHGDKKKEKNKNGMMHSSSGDLSAGSSSAKTRSGTGKSGTSDSGSSGDGSSGMGALLNPGGVSDVNTSSATYYSLGTGSIVAIVGVVAGIMGVLVLFATISRKKYVDDDDESPLPYGYNMDIRTVTRLSPTFMQDDSFMESGYNGTAIMVDMPTPHQFDGVSSTSGESADEVPSLRGNLMAVNHCDSMADASLRSRVPSMQSFNGDLDTGNVRVSALYSAGSSMTSGSAISGSWSSVLASDTERQPSRNTRDTSLSAWSIANLSSLGSTTSGASGLHRMTRSSSALSADIRHTGGSDRSHGSTVLSRSRLLNQPDTNRAAATAAAVESNRSNKSTKV